MTTKEKISKIKSNAIEFDITFSQSRKSLLTHEVAISRAELLILNNWGDLRTKMDIARLLKRFDYMGFIGQPLSFKDLENLFYYMDNISDEELEENGWI